MSWFKTFWQSQRVQLAISAVMLCACIGCGADEAAVPVVAPAELPKTSKPEVEGVVELTDAMFEDEVLKSDLPVLIDFGASWCGPCQMLAPVIDELEKTYQGRVRFYKVDIDSNPNLHGSFFRGGQGIPFVAVLKDKNVLGYTIGYDGRTRGELISILDTIDKRAAEHAAKKSGSAAAESEGDASPSEKPKSNPDSADANENVTRLEDPAEAQAESQSETTKPAKRPEQPKTNSTKAE